MDFVILFTSKEFEIHASNLQTKLQSNLSLDANVVIDEDINVLINLRIQKWKKRKYIVIVLNDHYEESNIINVYFSNSRLNSKGNTMAVDEFIDLINSYDDASEMESESYCLIA